MASINSSPETIGAALRRTVDGLDRHGRPEARLEAEWLFSQALGCARLELPLRRAERLPPAARRRLAPKIRRLAAGAPLAYVLGTAEFLGRVLAVDRRVLIPRPETELLAELVRDCRELWARPRPAVAEVGAGSGCLVISLALARPAGRYHALDISRAALALARRNARRHGVERKINFRAGNLLDGLPPASLDAVVCNPPYVRTADWERLPAMIREYEPRQALDGGPDGLAVIRPLAAAAAQALKPGGRLFLEIGADQKAAVRALLRRHGYVQVSVRPDLCGRPRLVLARRAEAG